jgi:broad specificity phosphatase PhoE
LKIAAPGTYTLRVRRLYLMRHGETLYLGGQSEDGTDLTAEGRRQIEAAAVTFDSVRLDLVVASPMRRAMGTAGIIAARQGRTIEAAPELREITPGLLDGMEVTEIFAQVLRFFSSPSVTWDTPFVGGETFRQLRDRVMRWVGGLLARPGWTDALAVAHGGANMAVFAGVLGLHEGQIPRLEQDLGCINVIDFDEGGRGVARLVNFSADDPLKAHLREPSFERLRRLLEERAGQLKGLRWAGGGRDPEIL